LFSNWLTFSTSKWWNLIVIFVASEFRRRFKISC
jgi:hypothetical protein